MTNWVRKPLYHLVTDTGRRDTGLFVGRIGRCDKQHLVEVEDITIVCAHQVPQMDGIELPSIDTYAFDSHRVLLCSKIEWYNSGKAGLMRRAVSTV